MLAGLILLTFILGIGYTGRDPLHGFQNKYLIVTEIRFLGSHQRNETIIYTSERQMMESIRQLDEYVKSQQTNPYYFFGVTIAKLLGVEVRISIYK